jgi:hypothetical protein
MAGVIYLYDNLALTQANLDALDRNGAALIDSTLKARIESSNVILANSLINVRWGYLGCFQCPEHGDTPIQTLWSNVRSTTTSVGAFAVQKALETGATHVQVYTKPTDAQWSGYADVYGHFGVIRYGSSYTTIAHELGHNYGLNHDRVTMIPSVISPTYDGNYSYGMVFAARNFATTDPAANPLEQVGDIMSYSNRRIPYFTNSSLTISQYVFSTSKTLTALTNGNIYLGTLATYADQAYIHDLPGTANIQPLGIPAGQPYACDGSRVFRENANNIISSGWYISPTITSQPVSVTTTTGRSFTLSVAATGNSSTLSYQWYKGSNTIGGAVGPSYIVTSATEADTGSYYVVMTANISALGSSITLTSSSATVTINASAQGDTSTSSGGGGGALNPVLTAALIAMLCLNSRRSLYHRLTSRQPVKHQPKSSHLL